LTRLNIEDLDYQLVPTLANHLPSDVQAIPAYGDVETICNLALFAGGRTITLDDKYPRITGPGMQLSFRYHPSLGMVAVFESYVKPTGYRYSSHDAIIKVFSIRMGEAHFLRQINFENNSLTLRDCFKGLHEPPCVFARGDLVCELPQCKLHSFCRYSNGVWGKNMAAALPMSRPMDFIRIFPAVNKRVHS
jgi:hypothetical protein